MTATAPSYLTDLGPDLDRAVEAAQTVAEFVEKYSWFIPWFIPDDYQPQLRELAGKVAEANGHFPTAWLCANG